MSNIDWRIFLWDRLRNNTALTEIVPETSMYGAGSLVGPPEEKPFLVIHLGDEFRLPGVSRSLAYVWAHDEAGTYLQIDTVLDLVRDVLCGPGKTVGNVPRENGAGGIAVQWDGNGPDQADDALGTLMRRSTYQLMGVNGNE